MQKMTNNIETRVFKSQELRADLEKRIVRGYAAVFNSRSEDLGGFTEFIAPGAFDDVLGDDVRALVNHEDSKVLARTTSGTLRLSIDERGLIYEFDVPNTTYGNDLMESIKRGDISQSSFGFSVASDDFDRETRQRTILKVSRLYDVSPVTYPAYPDTSVVMRKLKQIEEETSNADKAMLFEVEQERLTRALHILELKTKLSYENS